MSDLISREAVIDAIFSEPLYKTGMKKRDADAVVPAIYEKIKSLPFAQPEPLSDAYMKSVWTWLLEYQIKAAELKGRYTPYEVLSWVVNDWRKEHDGSDRKTVGD